MLRRHEALGLSLAVVVFTCSPALRKWRQGDEKKVKVILHYIVGSRLVWAALDPVSKKQTKIPAPLETNWPILSFHISTRTVTKST